MEPLLANHWYKLEVTGNALNNGATYHGGLDTLAPVPLPGAVWMMLTGIIGLFGYQKRNKKKNDLIRTTELNQDLKIPHVPCGTGGIFKGLNAHFN